VHLNPLRMLRNGWNNLATRPANNIPSLDLLRSLAILLVIVGHLGHYFANNPAIMRLPFVSLGWTGVDLFFVLSGYLIGRQLWKEIQATGSIRIGQFLLRRGMRIWPLYFAFLVLPIGHAIQRGNWSKAPWSDIFFVSNYIPGAISGGWSLSSEEQFYIILPITLFVLVHFLKIRHLWILPVLWLFSLPIIRWFTLSHATPGPGQTAVDLIYYPLQTHSDGLAAGLLIAWVAVAYPHLWKRIGTPFALGLLVAVGALAAVFDRKNQGVFSFTGLGLVYGALTLLALRASFFSRISKWQGFFVLSRLSYGMYLNHLLVLTYFEPRLRPYFGQGYWSFVGYGTIAILACMLFAYIGFSFIELPFLDLRDAKRKTAKPDLQLAPVVEALPSSTELLRQGPL
jgi:peptidoglycan/LPS O-acetylase OafA/YrhL